MPKPKKLKLSPVEEFVELYLKYNVKLNADEIEKCYQKYLLDKQNEELKAIEDKYKKKSLTGNNS